MNDQVKKTEEVDIPFGLGGMKGILAIPEGARGIIILAHGGGNGRLSPRNTRTAKALREKGLATLLLDLLTPEEELTRSNLSDVKLLARRVVIASEWLGTNESTAKLRIGYWGMSIGAAAALLAAAKVGKDIFAVVSQGGKLDLAMQYIQSVASPTLLIVGGEDRQTMPLNETAFNELQCEKKMEVIPGASHLFEEKGKLEEAAGLAGEWFLAKL